VFPLSFTLRLALAAVCVVAVAGKARDRSAFRDVTRMLATVGVPARRATPVAAALVAAEALVAVALLVPPVAAVGCVAAAVLFAVLTAGVAHTVRRGAVVRCRCFGRAGTLLSPAHLVRNGLLTAAALLATWATVDAGAAWPGMAAAVVAAVLALTLAAVVVSWDDLVALIRPVRHRADAAARREVPV
jgi:hypothetical protein